MGTVFGLFADPESTQRAINGLRRLGFGLDELHVITPEPYHEFHFTAPPDERKTSRYALLGGIIGGASGAALVVWTSQVVNLPTGGMPIIAWAPVGIVTFALAGLGAVAGTIFNTLRAAGMPDFKGELYDPDCYREVAAGGFLLAVPGAPDARVPQVRQVLVEAGANTVT